MTYLPLTATPADPGICLYIHACWALHGFTYSFGSYNSRCYRTEESRFAKCCSAKLAPLLDQVLSSLCQQIAEYIHKPTFRAQGKITRHLIKSMSMRNPASNMTWSPEWKHDSQAAPSHEGKLALAQVARVCCQL